MAQSAKVGDLSDSEFRSLLALWSFCSRSKNDGEFDLDQLRHAAFATPRGPRVVRAEHVARFVELGLVNTDDGIVFSVNDWRSYQPKDPTSAERKRRFRERS